MRCPNHDIYTGGHLKPDVYNGISTLASDHGVEAAAEVAAFEIQNLKAVQSFVEREKMDCDLKVANAIDVQLDDAHCAKLKTGWEFLVAYGSEASRLVEINMKEKAEAVCLIHLWPVRVRTYGLFSSPASKVHEAASATMPDGSGHTSLSHIFSRRQ